jgi:hypothetical protein
MEGTLVKREDRYDLYSESGHKIASSAPSPHKKLSKQNCDELFGVIDVEEIADRHTFGQRNHEWKAYVEGFNKAMELMKDKVFTLEDFKLFARLYYREVRLNTSNLLWDELADKCLHEHLTATQQPTEIEVTFNPEEKDSDGCLILSKL